jgi:3-oxoacyl-[acyl-carrier protein] reductase
MSDRLAQISGHLSATHARGLLADQVVIITGAPPVPCLLSHTR